MEKITKERWNAAQSAERALHTLSRKDGESHYLQSYTQYFNLLGLSFDLNGVSFIEIGPADFPALQHCENYKGWIIEPMPSDILSTICAESEIYLITLPVEEIEKVPTADEVWVFNVMQHIIDPEVFVSQCKRMGKVIRFFEPINFPTCEYHPHTFTADDFKGWFGESVNIYQGGSIAGFHQADCAYGTYKSSDHEGN